MAKTKIINSIRDCMPQRQNANKHTARGLGLLEDSIGRDGWLGAITVASDGETFDGSARLEVGASAGFDDAIVIDSDGSRPVVVRRTDIATADDPKAKRLGIAANRIAQIDLDWDTDVLADLVKEGADLSDLFTADEFTELVGEQETEAGEGGDEFDTTPDEEQTRVQVGDLWKCGEHRVLCGDSTKAEDVARLMDGEKADMGFADPPYGVDIGNQSQGKGGGVAKKIDYGVNDWDKEIPHEAIAMLLKLCKNVILWGANYYADKLPPSPCWIIWDKDNGATDFADCELAWTSQPSAARLFRWKWAGMLQEDMFNKEKRVHPTQKPVALAEWCFEKYGKTGDLILDPFLGSGMSLIAAERTNRKCYGVEISPKYVNVILSRYEKETGNTAELLERHE